MNLPTDPAVHDAMQRAHDLLEEARRLDAAIDASEAAVATAKAEHETKASERAGLEADLALLVDAAEAKALETRIRKLSVGVDEARLGVERKERICAELNARLISAEELLVAEQTMLNLAVAQHASSVAETVFADIEKALGPLLEALRVAHVAQLAVVNSELGTALSGLQIPRLGGYNSFVLEGRMHRPSDGGFADLSAGWQSDVKLAAMHAAAGEPRAALAKLKAYRPRAQRLKPPVSHERKGIEIRTWRSPLAAARPAQAPNASRPTATQPVVPVEMNIGSAALRDPAFEQFRP